MTNEEKAAGEAAKAKHAIDSGSCRNCFVKGEPLNDDGRCGKCIVEIIRMRFEESIGMMTDVAVTEAIQNAFDDGKRRTLIPIRELRALTKEQLDQHVPVFDGSHRLMGGMRLMPDSDAPVATPDMQRSFSIAGTAATCGVCLDGHAPCPVIDPPMTTQWTCLACGRFVGAPRMPTMLRMGDALVSHSLCPMCKRAVHASESDDEGRCSDCRDEAEVKRLIVDSGELRDASRSDAAKPWQEQVGRSLDNLARTWSVKLHDNGMHTNATIRHGIQGQRALLGSITFSVDDVHSLEALLKHVSHRIVTHAVLEVVLQLGERGMFVGGAPSPELIYTIGEKCREKCAELALKTLLDAFNIHKGE